MALLTIPSVTKGTAVSVSLNKTELFALSAVAADSHFSDSANVKRCVIEFNSNPSSQRKVLDFDLSQASPSASLLISVKGRDSFLLERLVLEDYDNDILILERSQLPSGLDVVITPAQDANTVFLVHFDNNLNDSSTANLVGTAIASTFQNVNTPWSPQYVAGKFGNALQFTPVASWGFGNQTVQYQTTTQCDFAANEDFTIEAFVKLEPVNSGGAILSYNNMDGVSGGFSVIVNGSRELFFRHNGSWAFYTQNGVQVPHSEWAHIAITRESGIARMFINGVKQKEVEYAWAIGSQNKKLIIGARAVDENGRSDWPVNGLIDEVRISKGVARYTANFTPPAAPLT